MAIHIILADTDEDYAERLESYILAKGITNYELKKCHTKSKLKNMIAEEEYDALLFTPAMFDASLNYKLLKTAIALLDEDEVSERTFKRSINKFTKITSLLEYIAFECEEAERNKPIIYAVYSPSGGVGKTTAALAIAIENRQLSKKVFYLNTENFDSSSLFFTPKAQNPNEGLHILNGLIQIDSQTGIMYFENMKTLNDHTMAHSQIADLLEQIIDEEIASVIVIDLSTCLDNFNKSIFELSNQVIIIAGMGQSSYKINQFLAEYGFTPALKSKLKLLINQEKNYKFPASSAIEIIGEIDTIYNAHVLETPIDLPMIIAKKHCIQLNE